MKILVLNGSPKKKSDTMRMTDAFLRGLNAEDKHEVTVINVIDKHIKPCLGCFGCWQRTDGQCVQQDDDQNEILRLISKSELLILSFPLYCYSMPSHLKAVIDRLLPLSHMTMHVEDDRVVHDANEQTYNRSLRVLMLCGCGFPSFEDNFAPMRKQFSLMFPGYSQAVCVSEAPLFNTPLAAPVAEPLLARFTAAGEEYDRTGRLSDETIAALEVPMISAEEYLRNVNAGAKG